METINHEYYVSLEVAKLLKEAGFDWKCKAHYKQNGDFILRGYDCDWNATASINPNVEYYSAPILDVTQRWLRKVKGIEVYAHVFYDSRDMVNEGVVYVYEVSHITKHIEDYISSYDIYHTHEEALESGEKKVLETILNSIKNQ